MSRRTTFPFGATPAALVLALSALSACGGAPEDGAGGASRLASGAYDYRMHIQWSDAAEVGWDGGDHGSPHFADVMAHTTDRYTSSEPTTNAHETMHGLLNQLSNATPAKDQYVYLEGGKGAYVLEPALHASKIKNYVPQGARTLAQSRYQLYLVNQVAAYFPNVLYQFDEWNAYVTGARVGVEMANAGTWTGGGQDVVDGAMDFVYFASAAALALDVNEPQYLEATPQFKAAYAMLVEESIKYVDRGLEIDSFNGFHARALKEHFVSSPENEAIRAFLKRWMGAAWTSEILGF